MIESKPQVVTKSSTYREDYADTVGVSCNLWDFVFTFGLADYSEGNPASIENFERIRISPQTAKALIPILADQVRVYEEKFGTIPVVPSVSPGSAIVN